MRVGLCAGVVGFGGAGCGVSDCRRHGRKRAVCILGGGDQWSVKKGEGRGLQYTA